VRRCQHRQMRPHPRSPGLDAVDEPGHGRRPLLRLLGGRRSGLGEQGQHQLPRGGLLDLPWAYTTRIESLRDLVEVSNREIDMHERDIHPQLKDHAGYQAIQAIFRRRR
jgi:hypothetical protein